jgi:hypothetical protein
MPRYLWKCEKCEKKIEVTRPISLCDKPPEEGEIVPWDVVWKNRCWHVWKKLVGDGISVNYMQGSGKGKWGRK